MATNTISERARNLLMEIETEGGIRIQSDTDPKRRYRLTTRYVSLYAGLQIVACTCRGFEEHGTKCKHWKKAEALIQELKAIAVQ